MKRIFSTDRLRVRQLVESDIDQFHLLQSDPEVMKFTGAKPQSYDESVADLKKCIAHYRDAHFNVWAIELREEDLFIGTIALVEDEEGHPEIGFRVMQKYWGYGYATEAVGGLVDYAFNELGKAVIVANVIQDNVDSKRVLEKNGFILAREEWNHELNCVDHVYVLHRT